jgi:hypothetical protein
MFTKLEFQVDAYGSLLLHEASYLRANGWVAGEAYTDLWSNPYLERENLRQGRAVNLQKRIDGKAMKEQLRKLAEIFDDL